MIHGTQWREARIRPETTECLIVGRLGNAHRSHNDRQGKSVVSEFCNAIATSWNPHSVVDENATNAGARGSSARVLGQDSS
jgi:hypothetical protein